MGKTAIYFSHSMDFSVEKHMKGGTIMKKNVLFRLCALVMALVLCMSFAACAQPAAEPEATEAPAEVTPAPAQPTEEPAPAEPAGPSGTFTASARGFGGLVTVDVTLEEGAITAVTAVGDSETAGIGSRAIDELPAKIVEANSAEVDGISGATLTSTAILTAVKDALALASGEKEEEAAGMTDGVYTSTTFGRNANITVEVTIAEGKIADVVVTDHAETPSIAEAPLTRIPAAVVEYQSLAVDSVAGATRTSSALMTAISDCISQAGGDVVALSAVEIPAPTAGAPVEKEADIVVIGAGGAGIAGAIAAAEKGSSVIVVEKLAYQGGGTLLSGAAFNAAVPEVFTTVEMPESAIATIEKNLAAEPADEYVANWQKIVSEQWEEYKAAGKTHLFDSIEYHMLNTYVGGDCKGNPELVEAMCTNAPETYRWLKDMGYIWSNVGTASGALWQRSHQTTAFAKGLGFFAAFDSRIAEKDLDIEVIYEVRADEILMEDGRAVGIHAKNTIDGTEYTIKANKGVLIATGGFAANVEMRVKYNTQWADLGPSVSTTNGVYASGDGIEMAEKVGAALVDMGLIQMLAFAEPGSGRTDSGVGEAINLWVNQEGERFVDETQRRDVLSNAVLTQTDAIFYCISTPNNLRCVDENTNYSGLKLTDLIAQGLLYKADTLEELAGMIGCPADTFVATVEAYNECVRTGKDEVFGRTTFGEMFLLEEGPFYACPRTVAVHHTMGGIKVDGEAHVIDTNGNIIPGLYAAGETTGGYHGGNRLGGNAVMEAITTGRTAGLMLADESK